MNGRIRIFVDGVTEDGAAVDAALLGCDAVGFDFRPGSPRAIAPSEARTIGERLPPFVARVGRFRSAPVIRVLEVVREAGLTAVLFDGAPPLAEDALAPTPWLATVPFGPDFEPRCLRELGSTTFVFRPEGWSGARPNWGALRGASLYGRPILASVPPEDAEWAIDRARPYGLCTGEDYEFEPGHLDLERIEDLVSAVRRAEGWLGRGAPR